MITAEEAKNLKVGDRLIVLSTTFTDNGLVPKRVKLGEIVTFDGAVPYVTDDYELSIHVRTARTGGWIFPRFALGVLPKLDGACGRNVCHHPHTSASREL